MLVLIIRTVAVQGYRSLRDLTLPLGRLTVITGANGSGKSSVYRSIHLLADAALNSLVASLAREAGLPSTFWACPEAIGRDVRQGTYAMEPLANRKVASLKLGFGGDAYGYSIDGIPSTCSDDVWTRPACEARVYLARAGLRAFDVAGESVGLK
jgi:predicted ATPase